MGGHLVKIGQNDDFLKKKKVPKNDFEGHKSGSPVFRGVQHPFLGLRGPLIEPSISASPSVRKKIPDHIYSLINHRRITVNLLIKKKGKRENRKKEEKGKREKRKKGKKENGKRGKREKEKKGKREKGKREKGKTGKGKKRKREKRKK